MRTLTMEEEKRLEVIQIVFRGELTVVEAAMMIGVSSRHVMAACSLWPRVQSKDCRSLFKMGSSIFEGIVAQTPLTASLTAFKKSGISILSCRSSRIALLCLSKRAVTK